MTITRPYNTEAAYKCLPDRGLRGFSALYSEGGKGRLLYTGKRAQRLALTPFVRDICMPVSNQYGGCDRRM